MNRKTALILLLSFTWMIGISAKQAPPPSPTYANIAYDQYERTKVDFWQAEGKGPRPLMVYIHGGGWSQGSKDKTSGKDIETCLANGISVASVGYRLTSEAILPAPVHDAARAIQFLRSKAKEWKINKNKIVLPEAVPVDAPRYGSPAMMIWRTQTPRTPSKGNPPGSRESVCGEPRPQLIQN